MMSFDSMKEICHYCKEWAEVDLAAHSSGRDGLPAMTTIDYSCGCSVTHCGGEAVLISKAGDKYKVVGDSLEKIE